MPWSHSNVTSIIFSIQKVPLFHWINMTIQEKEKRKRFNLFFLFFFLFSFIGKQLKSIIIMVPLYISIVEARMHELPKSINQLFPFLIILRVASCICFCSHYQLNKWMNNLIIINYFILFLVKIIFPDTIKIWLVSEASAAGVSQVCDLM